MKTFVEYLVECEIKTRHYIVTGKDKTEAYRHAANKSTCDFRGVKVKRRTDGKWKVSLT